MTTNLQHTITVVIVDVNVVDVNVTTRSKVTEEYVFKDKEPKKVKSDVD
jgi:hypothetical protein